MHLSNSGVHPFQLPTHRYVPIQNTYVFKMSMAGAEETAQQLRHWALLQGIQVQFPALTWWLTSIYNSGSTGCKALLGPLWAPGMYKVHAGKTLTCLKQKDLEIDLF